MKIDPAAGDPTRIEEIQRHIAHHIGEPANVIHEHVSEKVHIDIHIVNPTRRFPFYTLVTSGMSTLPMNTPIGKSAQRFAELCLALPSDWPISNDAVEYWWPMTILRFLARYPHIAQTWIGLGHTIVLTPGDPPKPFDESTRLNSVIIFRPIFLPEAFSTLQLSSDTVIQFYTVVPLFEEERQFAIRNSSEELFSKFKNKNVGELLQPQRPTVLDENE